MTSRIHPTAIIDPAAELDSSVTVGAYTLIGPQVKIGAGTRIGPHCVIEGRTTIGSDNQFYQFSSIGAMPQDMSHGGEVTELVIGDRNTVREFCTLNTGTLKEEGITRVGSDNWIMAYVHLAHDVQLGNHCVLANNATLAGHVHVGDWAVIGGLTGVHQFVKIGAHAMIGFQGHVSQDVAPFMTVDGNPLAVRAVNLTGLRRRGFSNERIAVIRHLHKLIFRSGLTLEQSVEQIAALRGEQGEDSQADVQLMLDFIASAKRGLVR
ncbi:acyl-ACP--UDP-N-acetylglucosamine O-acyltransferase [Paucibacter sp. DJ1R-11]|uniref:acyl-ACP--UDP-N-acetylglucosamine O-acyltransferase n=1 Tax=Paucibacter sp. DJ1R-11 TaxID=2893556 RepID=UPI0021E40D7C|nr:acyl-ACP--UDP-N-acetylglucosamine O-acyltransferase [Paucibacter sp. DJ1R-11]MCV2363748.1 acyl-ACP--UDP-N-acetylglucosamine O-acyltransferase [Paucibacter sp. DJ1R-11]